MARDTRHDRCFASPHTATRDVAGVLASLVMGGTGYGLIGDIIIGIVGAFVGGWIMSALGAGAPFGGLAGTIFVAFIGAVVLLFVLRLIRGGRRAL